MWEAFGGNTGVAEKRSFWPGYKKISIDRDDSLWWYGKDNSEFINRGKTSFNSYQTQLNNLESKENKSASTNGFIPVELGLNVDGISGIKIYQKLEVAQRFLPVAYSKSLRFLIRGVNHKIEQNKWTTELATISTTISDQPPSTIPTATNQNKDNPNKPVTPASNIGPIPPKHPNEKLKIYDNRTVAGAPYDSRTYRTYQSIDWLVGEMNKFTQKHMERIFKYFK